MRRAKTTTRLASMLRHAAVSVSLTGAFVLAMAVPSDDATSPLLTLLAIKAGAVLLGGLTAAMLQRWRKAGKLPRLERLLHIDKG